MRSSLKLTSVAAVGLLLFVTVVPGCGGKKRPPVLQGGDSTGTGTTVPSRAPEPVEPRSDVGTLSNEGAFSSEMPDATADTEGGPLEDVRFELDSSALSDAARATLTRHAAWLKAHANANVTVEGHCDERGTVDYNLALGEKRARAAQEFLVGAGVPAARMRTVSFGKEKPLDPASNEAAWAKNRRAHFVVVGR